MRTFRDSKAMAKSLSAELARRSIVLSHGECLDIVARQFGLDNWNVLSDRLSSKPEPGPKSDLVLPAGWFVSGSKPRFYDIGRDTAMRYRSGHPALIRCRKTGEDGFTEEGLGFATLMQSVLADEFRGHRVKLRADLRTEAVTYSATIWFRIDGERKKQLGFNNLEQRTVDGPLAGTHEWTERSIVLDVPEDAESLHFGFYLRGPGAVWAGGFELTIADHESEPKPPYRYLSQPTNLNFTELQHPAA